MTGRGSRWAFRSSSAGAIAAFGNSDGDLQMLQYTAARRVALLMMIVHHTDDEPESAYDRKSHIGKLDKALDEANAKGWTLVDTQEIGKRSFLFRGEDRKINV